MGVFKTIFGGTTDISYRQFNSPSALTNNASCPKCSCKRLLYSKGKLTCSDCGEAIGKTFNKYGAKRTLAQDGVVRDSKYEASVADDLYLRKKTGDIKDYESQFKVEMWIHREDGTKAFSVKHKVDFCIHHQDGSFELLEAKGVETQDYKWRRKLLELLWLPLHKDYIYTVIKQNSRKH